MARPLDTLEAHPLDHLEEVIVRVTASIALAFLTVLRNLLSNAVRYGGKSIVVTMQESADRVVVTVSDNGEGVPSEDRERIFEPYQRSLPQGGLTPSIGVGLTVARRLARLMGGDITTGMSATAANSCSVSSGRMCPRKRGRSLGWGSSRRVASTREALLY